jgi:UDP-N-acetylglucosamine transferase subunit ALG13
LVSPLDWGFGHASRCVPVIQELQSLGAIVFIAVNEDQKQYFLHENIEANYLLLPGYNIRYASTKVGQIIAAFTQLGKLRKAIKTENKWLQQAHNQHQFDAIISDNRYGLYHEDIPSFIITHQLHILFPGFSTIANSINTKWLKKFDGVLLPDTTNAKFSGVLSVNTKINQIIPMGILTRFPIQKNLNIESKSILCILSGPEPQKSLFEKEILAVAKSLPQYQFTICASKLSSNLSNVKLLPMQNREELIQLSSTHQIILSRSGYSTIMDLCALQKNAILVPTPMQTEQLYLAKYCAEKKWHATAIQDSKNIQAAIENFSETIFSSIPIPEKTDWDKEIFNSMTPKINDRL